jgi:hypothetical protein
VRHLQDRRHAVQPTISWASARRERQWNEGARRRPGIRLDPGARIATYSVVAALVAQRSQLLGNPDQGQAVSPIEAGREALRIPTNTLRRKLL